MGDGKGSIYRGLTCTRTEAKDRLFGRLGSRAWVVALHCRFPLAGITYFAGFAGYAI